MKKIPFARRVIAFVGMFAFVSASAVVAQTTPHDHGQQAQASDVKMGEMKMGGKMDEMAAKKKANTERLTALMAQVKSSTGDAKVAAMADVIAVLIDERAAMSEHCAAMMTMMKK